MYLYIQSVDGATMTLHQRVIALLDIELNRVHTENSSSADSRATRVNTHSHVYTLFILNTTN